MNYEGACSEHLSIRNTLNNRSTQSSLISISSLHQFLRECMQLVGSLVLW